MPLYATRSDLGVAVMTTNNQKEISALRLARTKKGSVFQFIDVNKVEIATKLRAVVWTCPSKDDTFIALSPEQAWLDFDYLTFKIFWVELACICYAMLLNLAKVRVL